MFDTANTDRERLRIKVTHSNKAHLLHWERSWPREAYNGNMFDLTRFRNANRENHAFHSKTHILHYLVLIRAFGIKIKLRPFMQAHEPCIPCFWLQYTIKPFAVDRSQTLNTERVHVELIPRNMICEVLLSNHYTKSAQLTKYFWV